MDKIKSIFDFNNDFYRKVYIRTGANAGIFYFNGTQMFTDATGIPLYIAFAIQRFLLCKAARFVVDGDTNPIPNVIDIVGFAATAGAGFYLFDRFADHLTQTGLVALGGAIGY